MSHYYHSKSQNTFNHPFLPTSSRPYSHCDCGIPDACGNPHKIKNVGQAHAVPHKNVAFSVWSGHASIVETRQKKKKSYNPPHVPSVCERPYQGLAQTCALNSGSAGCYP